MLETINRRGYKADKAKNLQRPRPKIDGFNEMYDRVPSMGNTGLLVTRCSDEYPCSVLVTLYAKMGLHRYNLLNGTNLKLIRVQRYGCVIPTAASTYYITMLALDPATDQELVFQTKVDERGYGTICFTVFIARPLDETETNPNHKTSCCFFSPLNALEWPPENPFHRFHLLNDSEVQDNDWIRLYLELAVKTPTRALTKDHDLSNLEIFKVAIDSMGEEGLNAKNATVYIHFKDPCEDRVGKDVDRVAIIRRQYDEKTGCFSLEGENQSSEGINMMMPQEKGKSQSTQGIVIPQGMIMMPEDLGQNQSCLEGISIMMPEEEKGQSQSSQGIVMPEEEKGQSSEGIVMPEEEKSKKQRDRILLLLGVRKPLSRRKHK